MRNGASPNLLIWVFTIALILGFQPGASGNPGIVTLSCRADNDLYILLKENKFACVRYNSPGEAIDKAKEGGGVLILADGYPAKTTALDRSQFEKARSKKLRIYVEYPSYLPDVALGSPRGTRWECAVISSDLFSPGLQKLRILAIHDCHFVAMKGADSDIVIARVAGFDKAVYGLPKETFPLLTEIPRASGEGGLLVSTTKLSQFVTARYAPSEAWHTIWKYIFGWLMPGNQFPGLKWVPDVRPSFSLNDHLPEDIERVALKRGIKWYFNVHMLLHPAMMEKYNKPANDPNPAKADPDLAQEWPYGHRTDKMMKNAPVGDGRNGILEGFDAKIFYDGSQAVRWWNRGDCNGEVAGTMGIAGVVYRNQKFKKTASNLGDWLLFHSMISMGDRSDPNHPAYGLFGWNDTPKYAGPDYDDGYAVYYGDDNARLMIGMILAAAALNTDRYDERLLKGLMGNLRLSSIAGFQPDRIDQKPLEKAGWEYYFKSKHTEFSPHYQANLWACYLWAYHQTGYDLFLKRATTAIEMTINAYPGKWIWTNGIQQERAKMLIALAWLVRVEDTPRHREWLHKITEDLLSGQDKCGAIREQIGEKGKGGFPPPASNEAYGTTEAPLIQTNTDGVSDLLYTVNFAFLGLHEAAASTGDQYYRDAEDKLAKFLCRIQIRSKKHPELDGGWFRAFDFNRWEYWASNADAGWGAWSIETGWTQSWITAVLGLRQMKTSIWEFTSGSKIKKYFVGIKKQMIPD